MVQNEKMGDKIRGEILTQKDIIAKIKAEEQNNNPVNIDQKVLKEIVTSNELDVFFVKMARVNPLQIISAIKILNEKQFFDIAFG